MALKRMPMVVALMIIMVVILMVMRRHGFYDHMSEYGENIDDLNENDDEKALPCHSLISL